MYLGKSIYGYAFTNAVCPLDSASIQFSAGNRWSKNLLLKKSTQVLNVQILGVTDAVAATIPRAGSRIVAVNGK